MGDVFGEMPGGKWGKQVYDFTQLYLQEKGDYKFDSERTDHFIEENLDYPESVDTSEEFFDACEDLRKQIDEVLEA